MISGKHQSPEGPDEAVAPERPRRWAGRLRVSLWCMAGLLVFMIFFAPDMVRLLTPADPVDAQIEAMIEVMTSPEQPDHERMIAAGSLAGLGSGAVSPLLSVARNVSEDHNSAILAVGALRTLGSNAGDHIDELIEMLDDENPFVVRTAARVLGGLGSHAQAAAEKLVPLLGHNDPEVRKTIVESIAEIGRLTESIAPYLIAMLDDPDPTVRMFTMRAIIALNVQDAGVQEAIFTLLNAPDPKVRKIAHEAWWEVEAARLGLTAGQRTPEELLTESNI